MHAPASSPRPLGSQDGFSLPEVVVTIAIVAVAFTAILGGMMVMITSSSLQRKQATADTLVRDAAEWVKDSATNTYLNCAGQNAYSLSGVTPPSGYTVVITQVRYWNGVGPSSSAYTPTFSSSCPSPDAGLQQITLQASSADGQAVETVQVIKRVVP